MPIAAPNDATVALAPPALVSDTLSNLGLTTSTLFYGLKFKPTTAPLPGFTNKLRKKRSGMDLDIACMLYNERCELMDLVWFKSLRDQSEAIRHQGDSLSGKDRGQQALFEGSVDPEQIEIRLHKLPQEVVHIALVLTSYYGQPLCAIEAGTVLLSDDEAHQAFALNLKSLPSSCNALWVGHLRREVDDWHLSLQNLAMPDNNIPKMAESICHELARSLPTVAHYR